MSISPIFFEGNLGRQNRPMLIFVEGTDDAYFLDAILKEIGADPKVIGVLIVGGTGKFNSSILNFRKSPFFRKARGIVVLRDADENPEAAISDTNAAFQKAFNVKVEHGKLIKVDRICHGLFVLPTGSELGDLEKLCLSTVAGTQLDEFAETYINQIQTQAVLGQIYKRKAQVFLAAIPKDVCRGAGMGFRKGYFDISHQSLNPIKEFLLEFINEVTDEIDVATA